MARQARHAEQDGRWLGVRVGELQGQLNADDVEVVDEDAQRQDGKFDRFDRDGVLGRVMSVRQDRLGIAPAPPLRTGATDPGVAVLGLVGVLEAQSVARSAYLAHFGIAGGTPRVGRAARSLGTRPLELEKLHVLARHLAGRLGWIFAKKRRRYAPCRLGVEAFGHWDRYRGA